MSNRRTLGSPVERIAERNLCDRCQLLAERDAADVCQFRRCTEPEFETSGLCYHHAIRAAAAIQTAPGPGAPVCAPPPPPPTVTPAVYYVRMHGLIKIGTTTNLRNRLRGYCVEKSDLLAVEPGGLDVEAKRHRQFAHLKKRGELFESGPDLDDHVGQVRQMFGDPLVFLTP